MDENIHSAIKWNRFIVGNVLLLSFILVYLCFSLRISPIESNDQTTLREWREHIFITNFFKKQAKTKAQVADLDGDCVMEEYLLKNGILTVFSESQLLWQTPEAWWIDDFVFGDINNDGIRELNLLVWKEGSFGPQRPFWIKEDNPDVKNHLFIFQLKQGKMKPVWQSSNLDYPNDYIEVKDINNDGENEFIAHERSYVDEKRKLITYWKWNGWGFSRISFEGEEAVPLNK